MSKNPGIFGRTSDLIGNTLNHTDKTLNSTLGIVSTGVAGVANYAGEFANDSSQDLVSSRVNLATSNAGHRAKLKELGYSEDDIDVLLAVEIH